MRILWLTWKDHLHPEAGGAEVVLRELSMRMVSDGDEVTWLTVGYGAAPRREVIDGIEIIRVGSNRYLHSVQALIYYLRHLRNRFDVVIEVINTAPYFSVLFGGSSQRFVLYHQLAREIWYFETKRPLSSFGFHVLEPLATRLLGATGTPAITVSESTRADLARFGFKRDQTFVISEGIELQPAKSLEGLQKFPDPTLLSLGTIRAMKRTIDQVEAFELARAEVPDLRMVIAGGLSGDYGRAFIARIKDSPFSDAIDYVGKVDTAEKIALMQRAHLILQTATKEGWGLTITEAASQGTPAAAYDVDGLRDSVRNGVTGVITRTHPSALAAAVVSLLRDPALYSRLRSTAWEWSQEITFDNSYRELRQLFERT